MKKETPPSGCESMKRFKFEELGPIYLDRDGQELTCEPWGVAYYTLTDFGCSDIPSVAFFHGVNVSDFNASDESGEAVTLTPQEKKEVSEKIIDCLDGNADLNLF